MARRDDAPFGVVATADADGDHHHETQATSRRRDRDRDARFAVAIASLTINAVPGIVRQLKDDPSDVAAAWLHTFVTLNLVLALLSVRRQDLSPPGSAAEGRARIAGGLHVLAVMVAASFFLLPLYGAVAAVLFWALVAATLAWFYKLGAFEL